MKETATTIQRRPGSGGARPGAGRKTKSKDGRCRQASVSLTSRAFDALHRLKDGGIDTNKEISDFLVRLDLREDFRKSGILPADL